jgi:hypothetical protein
VNPAYPLTACFRKARLVTGFIFALLALSAILGDCWNAAFAGIASEPAIPELTPWFGSKMKHFLQLNSQMSR